MGGRAGKEDKRSDRGPGVVDAKTGLRSWPAEPAVQRAARAKYESEVKSEAKERVAKAAAKPAAPATGKEQGLATDAVRGIRAIKNRRKDIDAAVDAATE